MIEILFNILFLKQLFNQFRTSKNLWLNESSHFKIHWIENANCSIFELCFSNMSNLKSFKIPIRTPFPLELLTLFTPPFLYILFISFHSQVCCTGSSIRCWFLSGKHFFLSCWLLSPHLVMLCLFFPLISNNWKMKLKDNRNSALSSRKMNIS